MILVDRYRIIGLLGRGGMGEVYRADDLKLGQTVALKFLPQALADNPVWHERFFAEVRIARQLAAGLSAAPERGVLHRDLKPSNDARRPWACADHRLRTCGGGRR